jgi:hypothetical protein
MNEIDKVDKIDKIDKIDEIDEIDEIDKLKDEDIKYSINKSIYENNLLIFNYFIKEYGKDIITENDLIYAFDLGQLDIIECMYEINPNLNLSCVNELPFRLACKRGNIDIIHFLLYNKEINVSINNEEPFLIACDTSNIQLLNILINNNFNIKKSLYLDYNIKITEHCFINACSRGNLNLLKWLYEYDNEMNISVCEEKAFEKACYSGNINIISWLLEIKPDINIRINNDEIFIMTTYLGEIQASNILLYHCKDFINYNNINKIFEYICNNGKYDILLWILNKHFIYNLHLDFNKYCDKCIENNYNKEFILLLTYNNINNINNINTINHYQLFIKACLYGNKILGCYLLNNYDTIYDKIDDLFYENVLNTNKKLLKYNKNKEGFEELKSLILKIKPSITNRKCFFCL